MNIYELEKNLKSKINDSVDDFLNYILIQLVPPLDDYYNAINLLQTYAFEYGYNDFRIVVLGSYLSSTWFHFEENAFIESLTKYIDKVDKQSQSIIYYLLAYDIYMKNEKNFPCQYIEFLEKSISLSNRFVYNYVRLAEISPKKKARELMDIAISNVETVLTESELENMDINDFLTYDAYIEEFILGVNISYVIYEELKQMQEKY